MVSNPTADINNLCMLDFETRAEKNASANDGNLKLAGNFVTTADDVITMTGDGTNWYEVSRSVN